MSRGARPRPAPPPIAHLNLSSACDHACAFCSIQLSVPPWRASETDERFGEQLRVLVAARRDGAVRLRVSGYDPLAFPRLLDLLEAARGLGFTALELHAPARRFADEAFARQVLARAPRELHINLPVLASEPALHDQIVGRPGAFAELERALHVLGRRAQRGVTFLIATTVIVEHNVTELARVAAWSEARFDAHRAQLPFPNRDAATDPYLAVTPRLDRVAEVAIPEATVALRVTGLPPCVRFRRARVVGAPEVVWRRRDAGGVHLALRDADPRERRAASLRVVPADRVVVCPHRAACALSNPASCAVPTRYAERYGLGELAPVSHEDLARHARAVGGRAELAARVRLAGRRLRALALRERRRWAG